jgi:hypothetical protein
VFLHLVARAMPGQAPLADPGLAWWMMRRLRTAWPEALAACVMPDHVHVLVHANVPEGLRRQLARVSAAFSRHARGRRIWQPVPLPQRVPNLLHLERTIRYLHLNPTRAGLVQDPICWPWSTHRGLLGAVFDPWVAPDRLAKTLGRSKRNLADWLHRYVAGDPSVLKSGTKPLLSASMNAVPCVSLGPILEAARAATPWSAKPVRRHAFVLLATNQGWRNSTLLARVAGISAKRIRTLSCIPDPELLEKATLCLGDSRLRYCPDPVGGNQWENPPPALTARLPEPVHAKMIPVPVPARRTLGRG